MNLHVAAMLRMPTCNGHDPDRRLSGVPNRRSARRGGRRVPDPLPSVVWDLTMPCPACPVGIAMVTADIQSATGRMITFECGACCHQITWVAWLLQAAS